MKPYKKPILLYTVLEARNPLASLSGWLADNELNTGGIATYLLNS